MKFDGNCQKSNCQSQSAQFYNISINKVDIVIYLGDLKRMS